MKRQAHIGRSERALTVGEAGGHVWPVVLTLTVVALVLRVIGLGDQSLWTDEMHTLAVAGVPRAPEIPPWHLSDLLLVTQGPLFMLLVHAWSRLVGMSDAALRVLPVIFAVATIPPFYALAERLAGARPAILATLLLAVSPFHIWYAQELRGYSLVILAAVVATLFLVDLVRHRGGVLQFALYAASIALGLGASLTAGFLLPVHGVVVLGRARALGRRRVLGFVLAWLMVVLVATPWLGIFGERHDVGRVVDRGAEEEPPLRGETTMPALAVPYTFYAFAVGFSLGPTPAELHLPGSGPVRRHLPLILGVAVAFGGCALWGLFALVRRRPAEATFVLLWILIPFSIAAWMAVTNVKVWNARYVAVSFPAFLVLLGAGLALGRRPSLSRWLAALLVMVSLISWWHLRRDSAYAKEDYRSAGAYLDEHLLAQDALIGIGAPAPVFLYAESRPESYLLVHPHRIGDDLELRRRIEKATGEHHRVWLLRARPYLADPENHVGEILAETRTRGDRVTFPGIELERYDDPAGSRMGIESSVAPTGDGAAP